MAAEFVRLADVPAIEEVKEEDTVLVVQDGDIKRAPKTAVGGSGGWDAIINCADSFDTLENYVFESGNYDTIKAKWDEGELPRVMLKYVQYYGENFYNRVPSGRVVYYEKSNNIVITFLLGEYNNQSDQTLRLEINADGSFNDVESFELR